MYVLNKNQSALVSGGQYNYVSQEWKEGEVIEGATIMGVVGAALGSMIGSASGSVFPVLIGASIGGVSGFSLGYGLSMLMNASLEKSMWYDFNYSVVIFPA